MQLKVTSYAPLMLSVLCNETSFNVIYFLLRFIFPCWSGAKCNAT